MGIAVRNVGPEELERYIETVNIAFLAQIDPARAAEEVRPIWDFRRVWGAWDGETLAGTFRSWATELTLPGRARVPGSAIAGVTVRPTHRRRGILRAMVAAEHDAIRERGEAVGVLHAAEYAIYGRFGYGPACRQAEWKIDATATGFHAPQSGRVEYVTPSEPAIELIRPVFEAWRARQPGEIRRRDSRWIYDLGLRPSASGDDWKGFLAVHRSGDGEVDGYVRYRAEEKFERGIPRSVVTVDELHALSDDAYATLWRFLAEIDLVATVVADRRSPGEALPWLLTNARAAVADVGDDLWVRVFDVGRVLEARTYEGSATLAIEIVDPELAEGRVRVLLDATPDGATARPTDRSADLTIGIGALSAAVLGGTSLRHAILASGCDEHREGALAVADALLRTRDEPWCSTFF